MEVEKIEHKNVLSTAQLIEQGIRAKAFPLETRWKIVHDFNLHYKIQQLTGHSDAIAQDYRNIAPKNSRSSFRGTIAKTNSRSENSQRASDLYWNYLNG